MIPYLRVHLFDKMYWTVGIVNR